MDSFSKSFIFTFTFQSNTAYTVNSDKDSVYSIVVACRSLKYTSLLTNSANLPTDKFIDEENNKFKHNLRNF